MEFIIGGIYTLIILIVGVAIGQARTSPPKREDD